MFNRMIKHSLFELHLTKNISLRCHKSICGFPCSKNFYLICHSCKYDTLKILAIERIRHPSHVRLIDLQSVVFKTYLMERVAEYELFRNIVNAHRVEYIND